MRLCVQYGVWSNCNNNCKFCLRKHRIPLTKEQIIHRLNMIEKNIYLVDWNTYECGISLLGGELFFIDDKDIQEKFKHLLKSVVEHVFPKGFDQKVSFVTNGIYSPEFLFECIDIVTDCAKYPNRLDLNFSYDLEHRYKDESDRLLVLNNITLLHEKYNHKIQAAVQMICTENLANKILNNDWVPSHFCKQYGCKFSLLYPHDPQTGYVLDGFFLKRKTFLRLLTYLQETDHQLFYNFTRSIANSASFKYTGLANTSMDLMSDYSSLNPELSDGKDDINDVCGHSMLYKSYNDSTECLLCDLHIIDPTLCSQNSEPLITKSGSVTKVDTDTHFYTILYTAKTQRKLTVSYNKFNGKQTIYLSKSGEIYEKDQAIDNERYWTVNVDGTFTTMLNEIISQEQLISEIQSNIGSEFDKTIQDSLISSFR